MIKSYLTGEQSTWDEHLGSIAGAYRATPHEATGFSPNMMATGQEVRLPADIVYPVAQANQTSNCAGVVQELRDRLVRAHEKARSHLQARAKTSKIAYDRKSTLHANSLGDIVWSLWCLNESRKVGTCSKLEPTYDGPVLIQQKRSTLNFVLQLDKQGNTRVVHHDKIKMYRGKSPPKWILSERAKLRC